MLYNWVSIFGNYNIDGETFTFLGGERDYGEGRIAPLIGNLIANERFSGGEITSTIRFDEPLDNKSGCEIILYYEPATQYFVSAGLGGGEFFQFSARYFDNRGWNYIGARGERSNLKSNVVYAVRVTLNGSILSLWISGVEVIRGLLPFTLPSGQVGLWWQGRGNIEVRNFTVRSEKPTAFVAMQFSPPYNELCTDVVKPVCDEFGIEAVRADDSYGSELIIADIITQINRAKIIIADVTPENPNVFYELGYAHAYRKPTILVAEKGRKLPFDVSGFRTLFYENTIAGKRLVEDGLRRHLRAILAELQLPAGGDGPTVRPATPATAV